MKRNKTRLLRGRGRDKAGEGDRHKVDLRSYSVQLPSCGSCARVQFGDPKTECMRALNYINVSASACWRIVREHLDGFSSIILSLESRESRDYLESNLEIIYLEIFCSRKKSRDSRKNLEILEILEKFFREKSQEIFFENFQRYFRDNSRDNSRDSSRATLKDVLRVSRVSSLKIFEIMLQM